MSWLITLYYSLASSPSLALWSTAFWNNPSSLRLLAFCRRRVVQHQCRARCAAEISRIIFSSCVGALASEIFSLYMSSITTSSWHFVALMGNELFLSLTIGCFGTARQWPSSVGFYLKTYRSIISAGAINGTSAHAIFPARQRKRRVAIYRRVTLAAALSSRGLACQSKPAWHRRNHHHLSPVAHRHHPEG